MSSNRPCVLVVESNGSMAQRYHQELERHGFSVQQAENSLSALALLQEACVDAVLISQPHPGSAAYEVTAYVVSQDHPVPTLVVASADQEALAVDVLKAGAADYVLIDPESPDMPLIVQALRSVLRQASLVRENRNLRHHAHEARLLFGSLLQKTPDACFVWQRREDGEHVLEDVNRAGLQLLGRPRHEVIGQVLDAIPCGHDEVHAGIRSVLDGERYDWTGEFGHETDEGEEHWCALRCVRLNAESALLTVREVTQEKLTQRALAEWEERCNQLTSALADYVFTVRVTDGRPADTVHSPACLRVTGYTSEEFAADPYLWIEMVVPEDRDLVRQQASDILLGRNAGPIEHRIRHKDGSIRWVCNTPVPHVDQQARLTSYDGLVQDITRRKESEQVQRRNEELFRTLSGFSSDFIFWNNPDGRLRYVSPACERITGYSPDQIREDPSIMDGIVHPDDRERWQTHRQCALNGNAPEAMEFRIITRTGQTRWVSHTCRPVHDENGRFLGVRGSNRDITELKDTEQQLKDYAAEIGEKNRALEQQRQQLEAQQRNLIQANKEMEDLAQQLSQANAELNILVRIDPLTKLLNRRAWEEDAQQEQQRAERTGGSYCVVMIDVDHFKLFNDSCGHQAGDECLAGVADCLVRACRSIDHIGRYGGEEFVILAPETTREQAESMANRIVEVIHEMNRPHPASPTADHVTVSVGVAENRGDALERVIKRADDALYAAKGAGRNRVVFDGDALTAGIGATNAQLPV